MRITRALRLRFCQVERSRDTPWRGRSVPSRDSSTSLGMTDALEEQDFGGAVCFRARDIPERHGRHRFRGPLFQNENSGRVEQLGELRVLEQEPGELTARF